VVFRIGIHVGFALGPTLALQEQFPRLAAMSQRWNHEPTSRLAFRQTSHIVAVFLTLSSACERKGRPHVESLSVGASVGRMWSACLRLDLGLMSALSVRTGTSDLAPEPDVETWRGSVSGLAADCRGTGVGTGGNFSVGGLPVRTRCRPCRRTAVGPGVSGLAEHQRGTPVVGEWCRRPGGGAGRNRVD
jgi:hypothetical protein